MSWPARIGRAQTTIFVSSSPREVFPHLEAEDLQGPVVDGWSRSHATDARFAGAPHRRQERAELAEGRGHAAEGSNPELVY